MMVSTHARVPQIETQSRDKEKVILVTGGAGYIGSHTSYFLQKSGYKVVILDTFVHNQSWPHTWATVIREDFANTKVLDEIFTTYDVDTVMHFAAFLTIGESVKHPDRYWENNVTKTLTLLKCMQKHHIRKFIFSSTCAIYGNPRNTVVDESYSFNPISPYATTKVAIEHALADYAHAKAIDYVSLRYFNVSGACPEFELGTPITHVTDIMLDCIAQNKTFHVFGDDYQTRDGTGVRDYVHVRDIANAHIRAMHYLSAQTQKEDTIHAYTFNLGTGNGFSVKELIEQAQNITGKTLKVTIAPRRDGDLGQITANPSKAQQELGWQPKYSTLEEIFQSSIVSQQKNLGYSKNSS